LGINTLKRKIELAKIVLSKLVDQNPQRWTALMKMTMRNCGTPNTFRSIMLFLRENGYIEKLGRGTYRITEKGRDFLKAI